MYLLGIVIKLVSTLTGALGKQLISLSGQEGARCPNFLFGLGIFMNAILVAGLDASSFAFAPQAVIAPLGGLSVCWNLLLAPFLLGEAVTRMKVLGVCIVASGTFMIAVVGQAVGAHQTATQPVSALRALVLRPAVAVYALGFAAWMVAGSLVARRRLAGCRVRGLMLGALAGSLAGCMIFVTVFSRFVKDTVFTGDWHVWLDWFPFFMFAAAAVVGIANLRIMAKGLQEFEAIFVVTIFEGCTIASAAVSAAVCLQELEGGSWPMLLVYWSCVAFILFGLAVIHHAYKAAPLLSAREPLSAGCSDKGSLTPRSEEFAVVSGASGSEVLEECP